MDKIRNLEEIFFLENINYTHSADVAGCPRVCNLNDLSTATHFDFLAGMAGRSIIENLSPIFLF